MIRWSDPVPLRDYRLSPNGPGIYVLCTGENGLPPAGDLDDRDHYLGLNWPKDATSLYIGMSTSRLSGIRGRLRAHFKGRGNIRISDDVSKRKPLWYIFSEYSETPSDLLQSQVMLEAVSIALTPELFPYNKRGEFDRALKRLIRHL